MELDKKWDWVDTGSEQFRRALHMIMETDEDLLLCGPGGTGKSVLLRMAYEKFPNSIVLGSTGISAANLVSEGVPAATIHSTLKIPPVPVFDSKVRVNPEVIDLLMHVPVIFLDEVSMVNASLMDFILKIVATMEVKHSHHIRVILFGDVFQLPPIRQDQIEDVSKYFKKKYDDKYFFFNAKQFKTRGIKTIHLDEVYRQTNQEMKEALNRIRLGVNTDADLAMFNSRITDETEFIKTHKNMLYLVSTNKSVDKLNSEYSARPEFTERKTYSAKTTPGFDFKTYPQLKPYVTIAVGQQVMCLMNAKDKTYQNGTLGTVLEVRDTVVKIEKADGDICLVRSETWNKYKFVYDQQAETVTPSIESSCTQIGCVPAFAVTLHKAQGMSLDALYLDLSASSFVPEAGVYLALSRCRTLEGIGMKSPIYREFIKINPEALNFLMETGFPDEEGPAPVID